MSLKRIVLAFFTSITLAQDCSLLTTLQDNTVQAGWLNPVNCCNSFGIVCDASVPPKITAMYDFLCFYSSFHFWGEFA